MKFLEIKVNNDISQFIDTYWELKWDEDFMILDKVIPDGCVDLIVNFGDDYIIESENCVLKNEKVYLGTAITAFKENKIKPNSHLIGIRFKPAAFSSFYSFSSLHETTNFCVEVSANMIPDFKNIKSNFPKAFDTFYYKRLVKTKHYLAPVIDTIDKLKGFISVYDLAKINYTTVRQLERNFKYYVGLGPKEYINIVRFKSALELIASSPSERNLFDIAFECGYYDQAHFSNQMKKYTGLTPSQIR